MSNEVSIFLSGGWGHARARRWTTARPTTSRPIRRRWATARSTARGSTTPRSAPIFAYGQLNSSDTTKVYYASPSFSGFQVGVSYAPENDGGDTITMENTLNPGRPGRQYLGERLRGRRGSTPATSAAFNITASGTLLAGEATTPGQNDPFAYTLGLRGGSGPFTAGVQWVDNTDSFGREDQWGINAAGTYTVGAWGFGLGYSYWETELPAAGSSDQEDQAASIGVSYAIAPGLRHRCGPGVVQHRQRGRRRRRGQRRLGRRLVAQHLVLIVTRQSERSSGGEASASPPFSSSPWRRDARAVKIPFVGSQPPGSGGTAPASSSVWRDRPPIRAGRAARGRTRHAVRRLGRFFGASWWSASAPMPGWSPSCG